MSEFPPIDESSILYVQQILAHIISKNKPRGAKPKSYAKTVRKYLMFFNDLPEDILMKDDTLCDFQLGKTFLKELKWLFSDEMAHLIYDALCSADGDFKIDLKKIGSFEESEGNTCQETNSEFTSEQVEIHPTISKGQELNTAFDADETQFDTAGVCEMVSKNFPNPKNADTSLNNAHKKREICHRIVQYESDTLDDFTIPQEKKQFCHPLPNDGIFSETKPLYLSSRPDIYKEAEVNYLKQLEAGANTMNARDSEQTDQISDLAFTDEDLMKTKAGQMNKVLLYDENETFLQNSEKQPKIENKNRILPENPINLDCQVSDVCKIHSELKALDFYPLDYETIGNSQLGKLVREEVETSFLNSLNWDSINMMSEDKSEEHITFFRKFYHVANKFAQARNSKAFTRTSNSHSFDDLVSKTRSLQINKETLNSPLFSDFNTHKTKFNLDSQWHCEEEQNIKREKMLKNLLQTLFEYLHKILKDFSSFHSSIFNWQSFLVNKVFKDIEQFLDETYTDNNRANETLNICCGFIKTAIDDILSSNELCEFLKWEEQCFLLTELCNSKLVCQNILEFLFDRTIVILKKQEELEKKQNKHSFQDPGAVEKLGLLFPMMKNLVEKYADLYSYKITQTEEMRDKEVRNTPQLWWSNAVAEDINFDFDDLQGTEEENVQSFENKHKWIQLVDEIIQLTEDRLNFFSHLGKEILQILKEARGQKELTYSSG